MRPAYDGRILGAEVNLALFDLALEDVKSFAPQSRDGMVVGVGDADMNENQLAIDPEITALGAVGAPCDGGDHTSSTQQYHPAARIK